MKKSLILAALVFSLVNIAWYSPRTSTNLTASQDVLASSSDTHNVGNSSNTWLGGYFRRVYVPESTSAPTNVASFGIVYVKSSDSLPYFITDGGTEYSMTSGTPSNLRTVSAKTASYSPVTTDAGTFFTTTGAAASVDFNLPALSSDNLGVFYHFMNTGAFNLNINPSGNSATGNHIRLIRNISGATVTVPASGDKIRTISRGASIVLAAASLDHWTVQGQEGDLWSDINDN